MERTICSMKELVQRLSSFPSRLLMSIHGISEPELWRPESAERWSIAEVIAHLADVELVTAMRSRLILVDDRPVLTAFDQEGWVERLHRGTRVEHLIEQLGEMLRRNVELLGSLTDDELERVGEHPIAGTITLGRLFERQADHQDRHLGQIERIKEVHGLSASPDIDVSGVFAARADSSPRRSLSPGIRIYDLWQRGAKRALQVEIDAGAVWPCIDYHVPGPEEVYVVSGEFEDGANRYPAGTFLHHPAGSSHIGQSRSGCVLFVYYPEG